MGETAARSGIDASSGRPGDREDRLAEAGLRARKKQRTRERILAVCGDLFRRRGFDATTIEQILEEVQLSRQTFFNYFAGKEAVLAELGVLWLQAQADRAREGTRRGRPETLGSELRQVLHEQLTAVESDRDFMRLVFTRSGLFFPQGPDVGGAADQVRLGHTRKFFSGLVGLMRVRQEAGQIRRDLPAEQVAEMYVGVMVTTVRLWLTGYWGDAGSLVERGLRAFDVLEDGLRTGAGSP